ncbi:MAG: hypothetical protein AAFX99_14585 [Myxococcota bacterium]
MGNTNTTLEQLRAIVHDEPSPEGWFQLCRALENLEGEALQVGLNYVRASVSQWPDSIRSYQGPFEEVANTPWAALLGHTCLYFREVEPDRRASAAPFLGQPVHGRLNQISARVEALANWPHLGGVTSLDLSREAIGPGGAEALARSPYLQLRSLDLANNTVGGAGARALASAAGLGCLERLVLRFNGIGDEGAAALAHSPHLGRLIVLDLGFNDIGVEGLTALTHSLKLAPQWLSLKCNRIDDYALRLWLRGPARHALRVVDLDNNAITDEGAKLLVHSGMVHQLHTLNLRRNALSPAGAALLQEAATHTTLHL